MSKQTSSSGYSSDNISDFTDYENNIAPDGNRRFDKKSPSEVKPFTISTNNNIKQQDDELDFGNPYDRIHKYDDNKDFEKRKRYDRRPLPLPPRPPPDKPENKKFCTRFCFVFGTVIVLLLCAAAAIKVTCYKDLLCEQEKENKSSSHTPHPCDAQIQQDYSFGGSSVCKLALQNPKTLMLRSENADIAIFDLGDSENSGTLNGIVFTLKWNSTEIYVNVEIQQVNCSNIGTYYVTVSNGTVNGTNRVDVIVNPETQKCPCTREENVGKRIYITCTNVNKVNVTVVLRGKTSVDNDVVLAMDVSINDIVANGGRLPIESDENIILIAEAVSNTTTFKLEFSLVKCNHVGTYAITFGKTTFETVFTVKSYAKKPVIGVNHEHNGAIVECRGSGQVRCEASVGCGNKPTMWENTFDGLQLYTASKSTNESSSSGMTYYEDIDMIRCNEQVFNNTQFMCNFTHDGKAYVSDIYTVLVVPTQGFPDMFTELYPFRRYSQFICAFARDFKAHESDMYTALVVANLLCEQEKENKSSSHTCTPPHPCDAQIQQDYSFAGSSVCKLALQNPKTLILRSENADIATFDLGDSENNGTLNGIVFTLKWNSTEIYVNVEIQQVNCSNIGTYYVTVSNGTVNETYRVNVEVNPETQECPCTREENVGNRIYITCTNVNKVNVTVVLRGKTSVDNDVVLAMDVSINDIVANGGRLPIESDEHIILIAEAVSNTTTFKLEFSLVKCSHAGTYAITFGKTTFETVFTVKGYAKKPVIGVNHERNGGIVECRGSGQVRCEASVGCGNKPTMWENTFDGFQLYSASKSTNESSSSGMTYYEDIDMIMCNEQVFNNTQFMCNFTYDGKAYVSDIYTVLVVPTQGFPDMFTELYPFRRYSQFICAFARDFKAHESDMYTTLVVAKNWCDVNNFVNRCHVKHPFNCDKWITCETGPVEQVCPPGFHFYFKDQADCQGHCGKPEDAECTLRRK